MAHITDVRCIDTSTTSGAGALAVSGAGVPGYRPINDAERPDGSAIQVGDTFLGYVEAVDASGNASADGGGSVFECGLCTYTAANEVTVTVPFRSSNGNAKVNWAAGATKRVGITMLDGGILAAAPSANQNDYNAGSLGNLIACKGLCLSITTSLKLTGLAATYDGHEIVLANSSTDFLLWLEHQNPASAAANRFDLPNGFPFFLMPGDRITLRYSSISSRWQAINASCDISKMGLTEFTDFIGGTLGMFTSTVSGTGASAQSSTYLVNTTERPSGVVQIDTGTTATGRATLGNAGAGDIVPTLGCALSVARLAAEAANSGTETWQLISGFADSAGGTFTDGVAWNLRWNGSAAEWSQDRLSNAVATRSVVGSPTPDTNYIWLVVFVNANWTRADFIFSTDSVSFTKADSPTTGLPGSARPTSWVAASLIKSVGTTQRNASVDLAGNRVDYVRG
jgi:hypothetical protein